MSPFLRKEKKNHWNRKRRRLGLAHIWRSPLLLGEKGRSRHLVVMMLLAAGTVLSEPASRGCTETRQGQKYVSLLACLVRLTTMLSFSSQSSIYSVPNIPHVTKCNTTPRNNPYQT